MRVAILGTGKMGGAMARRLSSAGHELTLWNRTQERAQALGIGKVAATPAEAAQKADVVISMLTDADAVRAAYLGDAGAVKGANRQIFVEMSTSGPDMAKELAPLVERAGAQFVEAPVLGSIGAVESVTLIIFASGHEAAIERARPVLAGVTTLAAELMAAGTAAGLNPENVFWVLSRMAPVLNGRKAAFLEHRYEPVSFALRDAVKDLRLAIDLYKRTGATTPITRATAELFERASQSVGTLDMGAIASLYERQPASH